MPQAPYFSLLLLNILHQDVNFSSNFLEFDEFFLCNLLRFFSNVELTKCCFVSLLDHFFHATRVEVLAHHNNGEQDQLKQCLRNPVDTLNSSLGMFSFTGEEFHPSDKVRLLAEAGALRGAGQVAVHRDQHDVHRQRRGTFSG